MGNASPNRIANDLRKLAEFTTEPGRITRQTYSRAWEDALRWLGGELSGLDIPFHIDGLGNLAALYDPLKAGGLSIGIGSHVDTVIDGGAYDGAAGIIAGLELLRLYRSSGKAPSRPIELIAFAEEEGGVFGKGCMGSEYMTAHTPLSELLAYRDMNGRNAEELAACAGLIKAKFGSDYGWAQNRFERFVEIHVEQGRHLQDMGKTIGVVEGVVGILRNTVTFTGQSNHAGTTRMNDRMDAAVAMAEFILSVNSLGKQMGEKLVATVGKMGVEPNLHNVVPGLARCVVELRGMDDGDIINSMVRLEYTARDIAARHGVGVYLGDSVFVPVKRFRAETVSALEKALSPAGNACVMFSWAGHDAKLMAEVTDAAMLFVPSLDGLSHCSREKSYPEDLAQCVDFLFRYLGGGCI